MTRFAWMDGKDIKKLCAAFAGADIRFVGGCVRDSMLGRDVKDIDIATPLLPGEVSALLAKAQIKAIPTGIDHGTVTAVVDGRPFEITTLRKDVATDGRHAEVEYTADWQADAKRRDFTMNALYLSPAGELNDYFGGAEDAQAGRVKFIGDPAERISEDYLRILRFFRFHAHYGKGSPDNAALDACKAAAKHIAGLSGERIQQEMMKLLSVPHAYPVVKLMEETGVLEPALGIRINDLGLLQKLEEEFPEAPPLTKLAALIGISGSSDARNKVADRIKLSNADARPLRRAEYIEPDATLLRQDTLFRRLDRAGFVLSATISAVMSGSAKPYMAMLSFNPPKQAPVNGDDLMALGYKPGKEMGDVLQQLHNQWVESNYTLSREQLLKNVKR